MKTIKELEAENKWNEARALKDVLGLIDEMTNITAIDIGESPEDTLIDPEELKARITGK